MSCLPNPQSRFASFVETVPGSAFCDDSHNHALWETDNGRSVYMDRKRLHCGKLIHESSRLQPRNSPEDVAYRPTCTGLGKLAAMGSDLSAVADTELYLGLREVHLPPGGGSRILLPD